MIAPASWARPSFPVFARELVAAALCAAAICGAACGQEAETSGAEQTAPVASEPEEIVVIGQRLGELRRRIEAAELAVFARFNDINSDDRFDIHCRERVRYHSKIRERVCESNSWREQDENYAQAALEAARGEMTPPPSAFRNEQLHMNQRLEEELRRLAAEDPGLRAAVLNLGEARAALADEMGRGALDTAYYEVMADEQGVPLTGQRVFLVRIGRSPWSHRLTGRAFTFGHVSGVIRGLAMECGTERRRLTYQAAMEWTHPTGFAGCALIVDAKRDTKFTLHEFP
jgi:hypothetical protein